MCNLPLDVGGLTQIAIINAVRGAQCMTYAKHQDKERSIEKWEIREGNVTNVYVLYVSVLTGIVERQGTA
jgi:hypothetical protein